MRFSAFALLILVGRASLLNAQEPARPDSTRDSVVALPPIEITVTRGTVPVNQAPLAISVMDRATLGPARQDLTLQDVLSGIPGLYLSNRYNFSLDQRLSIRGFGSRSSFGLRGVKVLLDGVPQTLPDGQGQLTNVDFGDVERVEVIRGSASSLYGNASGGVITLETRPPSALPFTQSVRTEGGSFGLIRWQTSTSTRSGPLAGSLSLSRYSLDGFRQHSEAESFQLRAKAQYLLSATTTASVQFAHASSPRADNPGALTQAELDTDPAAAAPNNIARVAGKAVNQQQASLSLRHYTGNDDAAELTIFGISRNLANPLATNTFVQLDRLAGGARFSSSHTLSRLPLHPRFTFGADLQRMRDDRLNTLASAGRSTDSILINQRETVTEAGPFLHLVLRPANQILISAGVRYDRVTFDVRDRYLGDSIDNSGTRAMSSWSGHAGVSFPVSSMFTPYANISTSFETPTTTELANRPGSNGGFNDQLNPQRSLSHEIGARGHVSGKLHYSAAGFVSNIEDALIQFSEIGGRAFFSNAGRLRNAGLELGVSVAPSQGWELSAEYTFAHYRFREYRTVSGATVDTLDNNQLAGVPAHFIEMGLRVFPGANLRLELDQHVSSSLFADDANTIRVNSWGAGVTDVRASWKTHTSALTLVPFFSINNLFGRRYVSSVTVNGFGGRVFEPAPGRNIYGGMEVTWSHK
ncbi:MAG: TonB-dependent receptor [Gemmatimonadota bacterium]